MSMEKGTSMTFPCISFAGAAVTATAGLSAVTERLDDMQHLFEVDEPATM
jgi:hypothetical protein